MFLAHFMGDIHQPLHVGFTSDKGGNTIHVYWLNKRQSLHQVWDSSIIEKDKSLLNDIQQSIKTKWATEVKIWDTCSSNIITCPDTYASESIDAACNWAYKNAAQNSALEDPYFNSRLPMVKMRLAQGGVRLAATLNRIFI